MRDIGKEVFHVVGFGTEGKIAFHRKIKRCPERRAAQRVSAKNYQGRSPRYWTATFVGIKYQLFGDLLNSTNEIGSEFERPTQIASPSGHG